MSTIFLISPVCHFPFSRYIRRIYLSPHKVWNKDAWHACCCIAEKNFLFSYGKQGNTNTCYNNQNCNGYYNCQNKLALYANVLVLPFLYFLVVMVKAKHAVNCHVNKNAFCLPSFTWQQIRWDTTHCQIRVIFFTSVSKSISRAPV